MTETLGVPLDASLGTGSCPHPVSSTPVRQIPRSQRIPAGCPELGDAVGSIHRPYLRAVRSTLSISGSANSKPAFSSASGVASIEPRSSGDR